MKAAVVTTSEATPEYGDFSEPQVDDGYEVVDLVAAGLHPIVRSLAAGRHYGSTQSWPLVPGVDVVARTSAGDFIYTGFVRHPHGTFAERMAVPKAMRFSLPPGADPVKVAGGLNPALASWLPLKTRVREIGSLATVLVLGVTGMAGYLAVQNARILGADRVVGVGRNPARLARAAALGASTVTLSGNREVDSAAIIDAHGGTTPSIVLDFLWASPAETVFASLARRGLEQDTADIAYVQIGATAGPEAAVPAAFLRSRRIRISGSGAGSAQIADIMAEVPAYIQLIADGSVDVPTKTMPLSSISEAWTASTDGTHRIVVVP
jgi:D-arabinose 1-dehydrogenase-like Zn-dependent alcohol dehydrogenase